MPRKKKKFNRRLLREKALQLLYAYEMNAEGLEEKISGMLLDVENEDDRDFFRNLVQKVVIHHKEFDLEIEKRVTNWELDRIALVDRLLLRIGLCEILYFPDIPPKVSINEAIEIAKEFSTGSSGKFINGILDNILTDFKKSGRIKKAGRGLMNKTVYKNDS